MDRLYQLAALIPSGTPIAAPVTIPFPLEDNELKSLDIVVPDGPSGLMGFIITQSQQQIVPWGNTGFLITNNEILHYDYADEMTSSGVAIVGYNLDVYDHTIYVRATITNLPEPTDSAAAAIATPATAQDIADTSTSDDLSVDSLLGDSGDDETVDDSTDDTAAIPAPAPISVALITSPAQLAVKKGATTEPKSAVHKKPETAKEKAAAAKKEKEEKEKAEARHKVVKR